MLAAERRAKQYRLSSRSSDGGKEGTIT